MKSHLVLPCCVPVVVMLAEVLIFGDLVAFGLSVYESGLAETKARPDDREPRLAADEMSLHHPAASQGQPQRHHHRDRHYQNDDNHHNHHPHDHHQHHHHQQQHQHNVKKQDFSKLVCFKQYLTHVQGARILNATGMNNHVTPSHVDPECMSIFPTMPSTRPSRNIIDFRGMSSDEEGVIVFGLNKSDYDLEKVVIARAELRIFMTAKNDTADEEPRKGKKNHHNHRRGHKERHAVNIYGLANDSYFILASINVRIGNSKWQKFLLSTSYVQNLLRLAEDELSLKIICENCEQKVEIYRGPPALGPRDQREGHHASPRDKKQRDKKDGKKKKKKKGKEEKDRTKSQTKKAPKLMMEIKEAPI